MSVDKVMAWLTQAVTMPRWAAVLILVVGLVLPVVIREISVEMAAKRDYQRQMDIRELDTQRRGRERDELIGQLNGSFGRSMDQFKSDLDEMLTNHGR